MPNDKQALNLFKTHMVLGPQYQAYGTRKPVFPRSITHLIMQYAQYEDWMKTATDLASLLKRRELNFITQSEAWAQDPSLSDAKKWLAKPDKPSICDSDVFFEKSIMPLFKFIAKSPLVDADGWTALMWAATNGHTETLKALLAVSGINVTAVDNNDWTVLTHAACVDDVEAFKALLAVPGINVNAASKGGLTALMCAARYGHTEILMLLFEVPGININAQDKRGWTALRHALNNEQTDAQTLIEEYLARQVGGNKNRRTFN